MVLVAAALVALVGPGVSEPGNAHAGSFVVTNLDDSGDGSLRAMLELANSNGVPDTITFASGLAGTIGLQSPLTLTEPGTTIDGVGASIVIESGAVTAPNPVQRALTISTSSASISNLTFNNSATSSPDFTSAIFVVTCAPVTGLSFDNVTISTAPGGYKIAVNICSSNIANFSIANSSFESGIAVGNHIGSGLSISNLSITDSTLTGLFVGAGTSTSAGSVTVSQVTISNTTISAPGGFAVAFVANGPGARVDVSNVHMSDSVLSVAPGPFPSSINALHIGAGQGTVDAGYLTLDGLHLTNTSLSGLIGLNIAAGYASSNGGLGIANVTVSGGSIIGVVDAVRIAGPAPGTIDGLNITGSVISASQRGIALTLPPAGATNINIADNIIQAGTQGIFGTENSTVTGNDVHASSPNVDPSTAPFPTGISVGSNSIVSNNTVHDSFFGVLIRPGASNTAITGNTLANNGVGIVVSNPTGSGNFAHFNNITTDYVQRPNSQGVNNNDTASVFDAENNWWGCDAGPAGAPDNGCTKVVGNVDYDPWIGASVQEVAPSPPAQPGETTSASTAPSTSGAAGASTTLTNNTGGSGAATVTVAQYSDNPTTTNVIDVGGGYVDVQVAGADATDVLESYFYYPSTVTGADEEELELLYFTGSLWTPVLSSGGAAPAKDTTDDLDGTVSGGRFAVTFDATSTPTITELTGTVFTTNPVLRITSLTAPTEPRLVQSVVEVSAVFSYGDPASTHSAAVDWGDGTSTFGAVSESGGVGTVAASHAYTSAGVYTVTVSVTDSGGVTRSRQHRFVVIYDPEGGFVTGGGWIDSPAGAYLYDQTLAGKATFGFVSKYKPGANLPSGETQFQFKAGNLNFQSTSYDWLVVAGKRAQYKGSGAINGHGDYSFLLTAIDGQQPGGGGVDEFRIKIWDNATGQVVYDNKRGLDDASDDLTALGGGSIVIHKP